MDPRETAPDPPDRRRERDGLLLLGRPSPLRSLLDAPRRLRARDGVFDFLEQPRDPGRVEVRQQADRHPAPTAIESRNLRWSRHLPQVRPVRRYRTSARRARRQCCRPPALARNVALEGERRCLAQLHLIWAHVGCRRRGPLLSKSFSVGHCLDSGKVSDDALPLFLPSSLRLAGSRDWNESRRESRTIVGANSRHPQPEVRNEGPC